MNRAIEVLAMFTLSFMGVFIAIGAAVDFSRELLP